VPGSGLGLALDRNLILAHCGSARADHGDDGGSRFGVEIPCATRPYVRTPERGVAPGERGSYPGTEAELVTRR